MGDNHLFSDGLHLFMVKGKSTSNASSSFVLVCSILRS